jgi:sugar phosphate isomerase/epimerase
MEGPWILMTTSAHRLRFAYSTINWGANCDIPECLNEIRDTGWAAVELFAHSLDQMGTPATTTSNLMGLVPATVFAGIDLPVTDEQRKIMRNRITFASEIGAEQFGLVGGGRLRFRPPTEAEYNELADFCEELAVFGSTVGVAVSYHPHVACTIETSAEIDLLVARTSKLRLCLDASHIALVDEDPVEVIDHYWDRLGYIHLKDWGRGKFQELGRGTVNIDFPRILQHLVDRHFPGWVVLEQSQSDQSPEISAQINADYLTNLGYDISRTTN